MDIMSIFSERLKELMEERELNAPALARAIGTDRTNITRYLRGERLPSYITFAALISYFGCAADFLLGRVEFPPQKQFGSVCPFSTTFRTLLARTGTSQYALEHATHISGALVYNWLTGKTLPSLENLLALADFLSCSVDTLLGRE